MEAFSVAYVIGVDEFLAQCEAMVGPHVAQTYQFTLRTYLRLCWAFVSPVLCVVLAIATLVLMLVSNHEKLVGGWVGGSVVLLLFSLASVFFRAAAQGL